MATIDLGKIKLVWRGTYAGGTAYTVDDVVQHTDNGLTSSFICTTNSTGNAPSTGGSVHGSWAYLAKGSGDATLTTQGDVLYYGGSGLARLAAGTSGQYLKTQGAGANPVWGTVSAGTYSVHAISHYTYQTQITGSGATAYIDIAGGNYVQFQPTSTNDLIHITHSCAFEHASSDHGADNYMMMKEGSNSIGSGDTKLNYDGNHAIYTGNGSMYAVHTKSFILPCTGLNTSSVYYLEQAGAQHNSNNPKYNYQSSGGTGSYRAHNVVLIHYKA